MTSFRAFSLRIGRASAIAILAVLSLPMAPTPAAEAPLREIAKLPSEIRASTRVLQLDASLGLLFEIGQPISGEQTTRVVARNLSGFARLGHIDLPGAQSGFGGRIATVDEIHHRLFVLYPYSLADDHALSQAWSDYPHYGRLLFALAVVDTMRFRLVGTPRILTDLIHAPPQEDTGSGNAISVKAISYFAPEDKIYLATEQTDGRFTDIQPALHAVFLHELDVPKILDASSPGVQDWIYPVPHCAMVLARPSVGVVFRSGLAPEVFLPCRVSNVLDSQIPGDVGGVVRVVIRPNASQEEAVAFTSDFFPISGKLQYGMVSVDPIAERLLVATDLSASAPRIWVFDAPSASWMGFVVSPALASLGVDVSLGRYYGLANTTFGTSASRAPIPAIVGSTRGNDVDQGLISFLRPSGTVQGGDSLLVDRIHHRLFWAGYDDASGANQYYMVIQDQVRPNVESGNVAPDLNTIDVREGSNTGANFLGGSRAYGTRVRLVGGWRAPERNTTTVSGSAPITPNPPTCADPTGFGQAPPLPVGLFPACPSDGTRDFHLARVMNAVLTGGEATAEAAGGDRDADNTDRDLFAWTSYLKDRKGPDYTQARWPYGLAACADFGGPKQREVQRGSTVECTRDARKVWADARTVSPVDFSVPQGFDVVRVGSSRATSYAMRDPKRGIVSVAESEARQINIGDQAGIGRVYARAETWATGRPKKSDGYGAGSSYTPIIEDVWVTGSDGKRRTLCMSPCSPEFVASTLTRVLGARINVSIPKPDAALAHGTKNGYEALIARNPFERLNDAAQNAEAEIRLEVPALVLTMFADGSVSSRLVVSLAGVSAESHYGIYRLARDEPALPDKRIGGGTIIPPGPGDIVGPTVLPGEKPHTIFERVKDGLKFFVATPMNAVRGFALWGFLVAPLVLMVRSRSRRFS